MVSLNFVKSSKDGRNIRALAGTGRLIAGYTARSGNMGINNRVTTVPDVPTT